MVTPFGSCAIHLPYLFISQQVSRMIGPRSMGAGAYASKTHTTGAHNDEQPSKYANDTFRTADAYGGIAEASLTPAQRLIESYERMNTPPPQTPPQNHTMKSTRRRQILSEYEMDKRQRHSRAHAVGFARDSTRKENNGEFKKQPSPIRQSLRNLLSVLKKGAGGISKRKSEDRLALPPDTHGHQNYNDAEASQTKADALTEPRRKMAGQLLYLTRDTPDVTPDVPGPLIWTSCSVTLECNKLVVSSFANDMQLLVHEVSLARCTDIRSVPASQLSEAEAALLEAMPGGNKMQVFEIIFKGKPREKFAAKSVRERAGWISAIWDGILPSKDDVTGATTLLSQRPDPRVTDDTVVIAPEMTTQNVIQIESPRPKPLPQTSPLLTPSYSDRSLPPLPPATPVPQVTAPLSIPDKPKNPQNLHLDLSDLQNPISPSIYPATFATASSAASTPSGGTYVATTPDTNPQRLLVETGSLVSPSIYPPGARPLSVFSGGSLTPGPLPTPGGGPTTPRSCPNSPSIANLSQLSVVRQRLAQIERNHSELSRQSSMVLAPKSRTSTPMKSPLSANSRWSRHEAVFLNTPGRLTDSPLPMSPVGSVKASEKSTTRRATLASTSAADEKTPTKDRRPISGVGASDCRDRSLSPKTKMMIDDVAQLSKEVAGIKNVLGGESGRPTIHQMVLGIEQRTHSEKKSLRGIQDTLAAIDKRVNEVAVAVTASSSSTNDSSGNGDYVSSVNAQMEDRQEKIIYALREVKNQLSTEFPALATKLKEMQGAQEKGSVINKDVGSVRSNTDGAAAYDFQAILERLDEIKNLFSSLTERGREGTTLPDSETEKRVETILTLVQEDSNKQALLAQQQADSVRYLNELNTWLEAFVNNGTSQIHGIAMNVDQLCKEIGQDESQQSLVTDIRQLISGMKARDQNFAALQAAVHSLLEVLTACQTQRGADSQAIAGLIDRQRHEQEVMFRAFTAEISGEIKGERLRFVEAMKEATAINVQTHVEHFKQELGREVMSMTEEVGRLHREKQNIENQISDLFAFYSKQKKTDMPLQAVPENVPLHTRQMYERGAPRPNIPRTQHRLGPHPR